MEINSEALLTLFDELKTFNDTPIEGYTRRVFSETEEKTLKWFEEKLKENGLYSHTDSVGNVFGIYGTGENPILIGSHLDTVQNGGLYDGALGVLAALAALITLKENDVQLSHPVMLAAFRGEEANILGGTFGSRVFAGKFDSENSLIKEVGFTADDINRAKNDVSYNSYIELHIEQGSVLEEEKQDIGIVTSIAGLRRYEVEVTGKSGHSGTTPMKLRNDALASASSELAAIYQFSEGLDDQTVLTIGKLDIYPNQANVIPNKVTFLVEVRSDSEEKLDRYESELLEMIQSPVSRVIKKETGDMNQEIINHLVEVSENLGYKTKKMLSGANHDANSLVDMMPAGMIFIPSKDGISHHPDEFSSNEQIIKGANVLLNYLFIK